MKRSDILNLNFDPDIRFSAAGSLAFDNYLSSLSQYHGKRYQENYQANIIDKWIQQGRFNLGLVQLYIDNTLARSLFIENYKGWVFLSRLISWEWANLPLLTGCVLPEIYDYAMLNGFKGVFASVNKGNRIYFNCLSNNNKMSSTAPLFTRHKEVVSKIVQLPEPVMLNYVYQDVAYKSCGSARIEEIL